MILDDEVDGPNICESKAAPFGLIHCVQCLALGFSGPPPLPVSLAVFDFFVDAIYFSYCRPNGY